MFSCNDIDGATMSKIANRAADTEPIIIAAAKSPVVANDTMLITRATTMYFTNRVTFSFTFFSSKCIDIPLYDMQKKWMHSDASK